MNTFCIILIILLEFLYLGIAIDCYNGAGSCTYSSYLSCDIVNNKTEQIKSLLNQCSGLHSRFTTLYVYKQYPSNETENLVIDIDLPTNLKELYLRNNVDGDYFALETTAQNTALTYFRTSKVFLESEDFFNNFVGLKYLYLQNLKTEKLPSFTNLQNLTYLTAQIQILGTAILDHTIVNGLRNLVYLSLLGSNFVKISENAFQHLSMLTLLDLGYNKISEIESNTFSSLTKLERLYLDYNHISSISIDIFKGLSRLSFLHLDRNLNFPLGTLLETRNLVTLYIRNNNYSTLEPFIFQQLKQLRYLYIENPFICAITFQCMYIFCLTLFIKFAS